MATLQEVYNEVMAQEGGREALGKACASAEAAEAFLAAHGCEASAQEAAEFLRARQGELADAELESVAGGGCIPVKAAYLK